MGAAKRRPLKRRPADEDLFQAWWERTWGERHEALVRAFGPSWPPGSPEDHVVTYDIVGERGAIPGACVHVCRPEPGGEGPEARPRRDAWLYVTHGLTQPRGPEEVAAARAGGRRSSGYGFEMAVLTPRAEAWPTALLGMLMRHTLESTINLGDRFSFGESGSRYGDRAGAIFWPYLCTAAVLATSTGSFGVLVATLVTAGELALARQTSPMHVQLLLLHAGVGQVSDIARPTVMDDARWAREWERIAALEYRTAFEELRGRWAGGRYLEAGYMPGFEKGRWFEDGGPHGT